MYRTTAQSRVLEEAFRVSDIPYRIVGGVRFYDRKEVKDVLAVLRLLHNPADKVSLERILDNMPIGRGIGPKALDAAPDVGGNRNDAPARGFVALGRRGATPEHARPFTGTRARRRRRIGAAFAGLRETAGETPLTELFDAIVDDTGYGATLRPGPRKRTSQRWANVLELRSDLERVRRCRPPEDALATYLEQVALIADVDTMDDDARGRVTLITLHSAKGLEFPVVFIAGVEEGLLPISRAIEGEHSTPTEWRRSAGSSTSGSPAPKRLLYLTYAARRLSYGSFHPGSLALPAAIPADLLRSLGRTRRRLRPGRANGLRGQGAAARARAPPRTSVVSPIGPERQTGQQGLPSQVRRRRQVHRSQRSVGDDQEVAVDFVRARHANG